ncbi:hypothetical protein BMF94_3240 [Rhodotorula taiwanensis]|uniref:2-dehydropantoate 2-reductase n=1 Tax=Rhodotorula taiwanensis TaxID=741276 RepID=A0A2S5BAA4_9BASI|nr:hypothetical protein BMF94_3240 [Rhodotorula taiwanensis]
MRFHCLGVGSIGSLLATNLAALPSTQVRLILRRKDLAKQLLDTSAGPSANPAHDASGIPFGSLTVERDGLAKRTAGLEMELTRSPNDFFERSSHAGRAGGSGSSSRSGPQIDPRVWNRQDPIQTLVVTTKTPATVPAIRHLLPRLSSRSTIVLCQNGMGVLEALLEKYWPEDRSDEIEHSFSDQARSGRDSWSSQASAGGGRPSFVCATTTHGAWRKGAAHFVHAGMGDLKFGVVPNRAVMSFLSQYPDPAWSDPSENPILNPRSLIEPTLEHLPYAPVTSSLHTTVSSLLACKELQTSWLPLPTLQIAQLQKLAVNASVNSITAIAGVHNGALVGSQKAKRVIESVTRECADVFAAHVAYEQGTWRPTDPDTSDPAERPSRPPALPPSHPLSAHALLDYTLRVLLKTSVNISSTLSDLLPLQSNSPTSRSNFSLAQNAPSLPSRTEIEYINGYIVALGRRYGIRTDTVEALGDLVLLKEEMARVGAVDRVWQSRGARPPSPAASTGSRTPSPRRASPEPAGSTFATEVPSAKSPRAPEHPHDRAARHIEMTRDSEARARRREYERIERDRDDRAAGNG